MSTTLPPYSIITEGRVRRSWGSVERQTAQLHPSVGTPIEVPLPNTVRVAFIVLEFRFRQAQAAADAPRRWSLQRRPCALRRDCSAKNFLLPESGCLWSFR